ncbi:PREDICTED: uncharacterized protein LOC105154310 isoform X2 [Acromyrmex echinatior]|uniref:uncharacterized protein LOC105154310 isoform X2 n=1 Tax=Acromyrmex echinatior TaxID=103372 RepID=UPI000580EB5D|nr:PREDICTED: uncharacterized protein LOC105154310 isoform X2 [Acromyrmex echinatior]
MASREKKPLAPSKSKQKASNDSVLPSNEVKNKKGKSLLNVKQQLAAQEIFDTVATGSQLPVKIEASLPRRNALKNLKRKQKNLRATKTNLIKSKVTKKVTNRIAPDIKRGAKGTKRVRQLEDSTAKAADIAQKFSENQTNNGDNEGKGTETPSKSAKSNLRTKKTKSDVQNKEEAGAASSAKVSPKLGKKGKTTENPDSLSKSAKTVKLTNLKKNSSSLVKVTETDNKSGKNRKSTGKELDCGTSARSNTSVEKFPKTILDNKNSIDLTIDEVIASMLSDSEVESQQSVTEKAEGKAKRSKKMLVDENIACDIEIKKEPDTDDTKGTSDGESIETDQGLQNAIQLRKRSKVGYIEQSSQRSLRNGKQRQLSDLGNSADNDPKKRHRINSDGTVISDNSIEHISDCNINIDSCFSDPGYNESQNIAASSKEEICSKDEAFNFEEDIETGSELENNNNRENNSDRADRTGETGPTLRSKTKAKTTECEVTRDDDIKIEDVRIVPRCTETQEDSKKLNNFDQMKRDNILAKFTDKSKGRRSSLNIDMKKTVNSFYSTDKSDGNSKSQIDQMIEDIKLNIAKSIENKIFGPEKGLGLSKNFDVPKIEEIVAPLSTESQKMGLEDNTDEDKSTVTKNEITSENSENSVPKVADTAKEIEEKLVKFDIGEAETHSQNVQENKSSDNDGINDVHNNCESTCNINNSNAAEQSYKNVDEPEKENVSCSTTSGANVSSTESKILDENKKITRKSPRINDKNFTDSVSNNETRKSNRTPNKTVSRSDNMEDIVTDIQKSTNEETISEDQILDDDIVGLPVSASMSPEQTEKRLTEEHIQAKETEELEIEISLNVTDNSEEAETLESISREVERLVAEDHSAKSLPILPNITNDTIRNDVDTKILEKELEIENNQETPENSLLLGSVVDDTNETPSKSLDEKSDTTELLQDNDASCKTAQSAKRPKVNNNLLHVPTTVNCDSNNSSVNSSSVQCTSDRLNIETKEDLDHDSSCKELNKSSDISNTDESTSEQKLEDNEATLITDQSSKFLDGKNSDERKLLNEENKRVLRTRDKQKKIETKQTAFRNREHADNVKIKEEFETIQKTQISDVSNDANEMVQGSVDDAESSQKTRDINDSLNNELDVGELEPQARSRRGREVKKRKEELSNSSKTKRVKRDLRRSDQQNKEETLLDNEVAKINENNRSFLSKYGSASDERMDSFRGFFKQDGQSGLVDKVDKDPNLRSKSENDIETIVGAKIGKNEERQLSRNLSENHVSQQTSDNIDILENERKTLKTPELAHKDSDETSTSGESFNSGTPKILETPEDKERKESILRLLGLESLEEAAKRQNEQQKKKEQSSSGTLKTIIRVSQKEKDKDKRGSRSPLKMVLKQQGRGDGEGDSPEFYTIQKEFGTSGLGDSSSDDDNEEATPKDRQSLVIPEKSSSFSIHPGRVCVDVCCYCFGKFGSLDTPMHLAQIKSDERRKKILNIERHLTKDSCLCDACYRHVDRKANTSPANMQQKPQKQHRQLMMSKCSARECRDPARHHVKRRWLLKIKTALQNQIDIDWDSSQNTTSTTMSFCVNHYEKIGHFLTCALCKRRLARQHTHQLSIAEIDELNHKLSQQGIPVLLAAGTFVCKLCRYFAQVQLKYRELENMNANHRIFCKNYRKRILRNLGINIEDEDDDSSQQMNQANQTKDKKSKKSIKNLQAKSGSSKSPERTTSGTSDKSTPEPNKNESTVECNSEMDNENRAPKSNNDENGSMDVQYLENTVENLKKRKILDLHTYTSSTSISSLCDGIMANGMTLGMDEVTLTRLPKRPRLSNNNNDIAPVVQRLGANPSISVRTLFPGEEEMNLHVNIEFQNVREVTPQGWEKCATMIQYDRETKHLWQQLQRPYGNQSSFLRHLILLEKYYRAGDLILAPNASRNAINYSTSVQNRLISYEGPEKMDEPIMEPIATEYSNSRRLSGGYVLEKDRLSVPGTSLMSRPLTSGATSSHSAKINSPRMLKLSSGVSIIKKSPPNLQRLTIPSTSGSGNGSGDGGASGSGGSGSSNGNNNSSGTAAITNGGGNVKRKDSPSLSAVYGSGGKVFQLCELDMKRMQTFKRQKFNDKPVTGTNNGSSTSGNFRSQYQKTQIVVPGHDQQFQRHLRMQQEMLNRQSRGDFEPLICDMTRTTTCTNENSPTTSQNILHNLNLPKSIQVTTKPTSTSTPIPILPKIPKSLTVIPQTVTRSAEK